MMWSEFEYRYLGYLVSVGVISGIFPVYILFICFGLEVNVLEFPETILTRIYR